jgi:putative effector of murein hydrolase
MVLFFILMFTLLSYVVASPIKEETKTSFYITFFVLCVLIVLFSFL